MSWHSRALLAVGISCLAGTAWAWSRQAEPALPAVGSAAVDGFALFQAKGCATCHTGPDSQARIQGFPDLRGAPSWDGRGAAGQSAAQYVEQSILEPWAVRAPGFAGPVGPVALMPRLDVTPNEAAALEAYLTGADHGPAHEQLSRALSTPTR